jgi:hypothetical protein
MSCCACGEPTKMLEGRTNHAQILNLPSRVSWICRECARAAAGCWARKARLEVQPPTPPKPPTNGPTGDTIPAALAERAA